MVAVGYGIYQDSRATPLLAILCSLCMKILGLPPIGFIPMRCRRYWPLVFRCQGYAPVGSRFNVYEDFSDVRLVVIRFVVVENLGCCLLCYYP